MSEIGVFYSEQILKRNGGPSTYLYNLREGMTKANINLIEFIIPNMDLVKYPLCFRMVNRLMGCWIKYTQPIKKFGLLEKFIIWSRRKHLEYQYNCWKELLNGKKMIHFHSIYDIYGAVYYGKYQGVKILTMHAPEPIADEVVASLQEEYNTDYSFPRVREWELSIQEKACQMADAFIFPCQECEELYEKWPFFEKNKGKKRIEYVYTGTIPTIVEKNSSIMREELGIPDDEVVFIYCGRHSKVKGYDLLLKAFESIDEKVQVVCAGKINKEITYPDSENWHELGWREDMPDILSMGDILVLPNRNTYFDLVALEAMEKGKVILASNTGGNVALGKVSEGVVLFHNEDVSDLQDAMKKLAYLGRKQLREMGEINKGVYQYHFSPEVFAVNYCNTVNKLMDDFKFDDVQGE